MCELAYMKFTTITENLVSSQYLGLAMLFNHLNWILKVDKSISTLKYLCIAWPKCLTLGWKFHDSHEANFEPHVNKKSYQVISQLFLPAKPYVLEK